MVNSKIVPYFQFVNFYEKTAEMLLYVLYLFIETTN